MRLLLLTLLPCLSIAASAEPKRYAVSPSPELGCSAMVEKFCDDLWAPGFEGNLILTSGDEPGGAGEFPVLLGRTPNQTSYSFNLFGKAKLAAEERLPKLLLNRLRKRQYFTKLKAVLDSKPLLQMTRQESEANRSRYAELSVIWETSIEEAAVDAVNAIHPGFFRLTDEHMPTALSQKYYQAKDKLETEVNRAIWSKHPRWAEMERIYARVQNTFVALIRSHPGFSSELKELWEKRIRAIRLMIPGTEPELLDDHDRRCAATERNAIYWTLRDQLEICGGYILSGDPSRTLSHELGHALGMHRNEVEHMLASRLAQQLVEARNRTCSKDYLSCQDWAAWKSGFQESLAAYRVSPELDPAYLSCFQTRSLKPAPDPATLDYISREWVSTNLEDQAKRDRLIRLIKKNEIIRDGTEHPNPAYLNPCGLYYVNILKDPFNPSYTLNSFFVNEYRCRREESPKDCDTKPEKCLEDAIERAKELELRLRTRELQTATRYSAIRELQRHGYAEDIEEDIADNVGQIAFANQLKSVANLAERRAAYFSTIAPLCDEPSIAKQYPAEAEVQKKYYVESHSEGIDRRRKLLVSPIREALGCKMDFKPERKECDWMAARGIEKPESRPVK